MKKISSLVLAFAFTLSPLAAAAQEAPGGGPGGPGDTEVLVYFPAIRSSNVTSATISHAPEAEACVDTDEIMVSLSGVAAGSSEPLSMELGTTTCSGGTWAFTFDASGFADGSIDADVYVNNVLLDEVVATKDTVGPEVLTYLGGSSYATTFDDGHVFDTASDLLFIEFQASDAATLMCSVDGSAAASCIDLFNFDETYIDIYGYDFSALEAGPHTFSVSATDSYDNESTLDIDFCIDTCEEGFDIAGSIDLIDGCEVVDSASNVHLFPTSTTTEYLAICVLQIAMEDGIVDDIEFQDFGFGLFVNSVNGHTQTNTYWKLVHNDVSASVGASELAVEAGDTVQLVLTAYDPDTFEETELDYRVTITIDSLVDWYNNIVLPNGCSVVDTADDTHEFSGEYLAICAVVEALSEGYIDSFDVVYFEGFGLFIDNFNDIEKPENTYWQFFVGDDSSDTGVTDTELVIGDEISFLLSDFDNNPVESCECIHARVVDLVEIEEEEPTEEEGPSSGGGGGGGGGGVSHLTFNVPAALAYLSAKQNVDGSFSSSLLSDWAAIAFAAADPGDARTKLRAYLASNTPSLTGVQDHIRHAMALMALGIDPYSGTATDHIAPILASYDGTQIGDSSLDNDDIFALFPLLSAGYTQSDLMVQNIAAFIISRQSSNGSWTGGADMTAAAVQALSPLASLPGVSTAITQAENYLHSQQQSNGGFGSSSATSWTMQAIAALGQNETAWTSGGLYPRDHLASLQQSDGGVEATSASDLTRIWATEYAIPGAVGKTWHALLSDFSKPSSTVTGGGGATTVSTSASSSAATTTEAVATTTVAVATSTASSATSTVIAAIVEDIQDETPAQAFETRVAQIDAPADPAQEETVQVVAETREEALEQVAAAAGAGIDWNMLVLAFLALILFGIVGYVAFVRKYWR